jgi:PPOX class probable F420-dependent enzyme
MTTLTMTRPECQAFVADVHVGILSVAEPGRGPATSPVWYAYAPGGPIRITAGRDSRKVRLIERAGRASLCVQSEELPYRYVSVEGPVAIVHGEMQAEQRAIAFRYLGETLGERYLASLAGGLSQEVLLHLRPQRWWSRDFSRLSLG